MIIKRIGRCGISFVTTDEEINKMLYKDYKVEIGMNQIVIYCTDVDTLATRTLIRERVHAALCYYDRKNYELYQYTVVLNDVVQVHERFRKSYTKIVFDIV
jgi:hypothetical protein